MIPPREKAGKGKGNCEQAVLKNCIKALQEECTFLSLPLLSNLVIQNGYEIMNLPGHVHADIYSTHRHTRDTAFGEEEGTVANGG